MKIFIFCLLLICKSYSQKLVILDSINYDPLSFSKLYNLKNDEVLNSNINGVVNLKNKKGNYLVNCPGFTSKKISVPFNRDTLFLSRKNVTLETIVLFPKKKKTINIGYYRNKTKAYRYKYKMKKGFIYLVLIPNKEQLQGYIKTLNFKISNTTNSDLYIRPYVFANKSDNSLGKSLLNKNLIYKVLHKNIVIDIEDMFVLFPKNGIYIGVELVGKSKAINIALGKSAKCNSYILVVKKAKKIKVPLKMGGNKPLNWQFGITI